jgi:hypothetical protein
VRVPARSNIFGAGISELPAPAGGGGGVAPACVAVGDEVRYIRVLHVTGSISFVGPWFNRGGVAHKCAAGAEVANASSDSDGVRTATTCGWEPDGGTIDAAGVVSSITSSDRVGYLVAVFLPDSQPVGPGTGWPHIRQELRLRESAARPRSGLLCGRRPHLRWLGSTVPSPRGCSSSVSGDRRRLRVPRPSRVL